MPRPGHLSHGLVSHVISHPISDGAIDPLDYGALVLSAMTWAVYSVQFRCSRLSALQSSALICFWSAVIFIPVYVGWRLSSLGQALSQEIKFQLI